MQQSAVPGQLPDLITFLEGRYRQDRGLSPVDQTGADDFITWAKTYLLSNRPNEVFAVDNNYGVLLTDGYRIKISPDPEGYASRSGDMANPDSSISIMKS